MTKDIQLKLRIDADDKARLDDLAEHFRSSAATVVRMLVKEKHALVIKPPTARDAILRAIDRYRTKVDAKAPVPERYIDHVVVVEGKIDPFEKQFAFETLVKDGTIRKARGAEELSYWGEGEGPKR